MAKKRPSSIDVARLAGVSQSAVSRAFTPGAVISRETLAKVRSAADKLNYKPNVLARALITSRSNIIALVVGDIENPFYARLANILSLRFQADGYHVLLFSVTGDHQVDEGLNELLKYRVDGVLLVSAALSAQMADGCQRAGTPVVLFNRYARQSTVSAVRVENYEGGRQIAEHLLALGHERFAFISGTAVDETSADRERGFAQAVRAAGREIVARAEGDYSFASGARGLIDLWQGSERFDALFCCADLMAFGALDAARHTLGLQVPRDLSIAGFDDLPASSWPSYDLTTIRQPIDALVAAAVDTLLAKINNTETLPRTILLSGTLVPRGSTTARGDSAPTTPRSRGKRAGSTRPSRNGDQ